MSESINIALDASARARGRLVALSEAATLRSGGLCEEDLLGLASWCLATIHVWRAAEIVEIEDVTEHDQREVIALAARGMVAPARLAAIDDESFTGARDLAWFCARLSACRFNRGSTFALAREYLGIISERPGDCPRSVWIELLDDAAQELERAEDIERPSIEAIGRLLARQRAQRARGWIAPVLEAMDRGAPLVDTAAKFREAANIFEERT